MCIQHNVLIFFLKENYYYAAAVIQDISTLFMLRLYGIFINISWKLILIVLLVVEGWNRQHHGQTIHTTENLISMNLFKILWVVTWALLFLTSIVMEAVRGQKRYSERTLWHSTQRSVHPTVLFLLTKKIKSNLNVHQ